MSKGSVMERGDGAIAVLEEIPKPGSVLDAELSRELIKRTVKLNDTSIDLALRVKEAREFLAWSSDNMKVAWLDWEAQSKGAVKSLSQDRFAFERESKSIIETANSVVSFFLSKEYQAAHASLKEMVELLERFSELKKSGVVDVFLNLKK